MRSVWCADFRMIKDTSIKGVSLKYKKSRAVLFRDNALVQQWPGNGSMECQGLNKDNFLNICLNGINWEFINIYIELK
jgi:hypothetical protein